MKEKWIKEAKKNKCYALLIVMDTFDYECFPVEVLHKKDIISEQIKFNNHNEMLSLKETIILGDDIPQKIDIEKVSDGNE